LNTMADGDLLDVQREKRWPHNSQGIKARFDRWEDYDRDPIPGSEMQDSEFEEMEE